MKRIKKKIINAIDRRSGELQHINRALFDNPETNYQEFFATDFATRYLTKNHFVVEPNLAGLKTAFRATADNAAPTGPTVAIIAEYDALPEIGHACGHSMIAATSLVAAAALREAGADLPGRLLVIGTPAEEGGGGKVRMIAKSAFDGIDAAIMTHPSNKTRVVANMYAISNVEFTFTGKASHAAAFPDRGVNALDAGVLFYNGVSLLRQQMKDEARVHGIFTHGGDAPNIIPERVVMCFYIRALTVDYFGELKKQVFDCARGAAKATGCKVRIKPLGHTYLPFCPNKTIGKAFRANMAAIGIVEDSFAETEEIGSSDIGNLSQVVPALHPEYAIGNPDDINHSRNFLSAVTSDKGQEAMVGMTKAMALTVYDLLTDQTMMSNVQEEFQKMISGS